MGDLLSVTVAELTRSIEWSRYETYSSEKIVWVNYAPGIYYAAFDGSFGLTGESNWIQEAATVNINYVGSVIVDYTTVLDSLASVAALVSAPGYYWDTTNKYLYVRLANLEPVGLHSILIGNVQGFTDADLVYIDDLAYDPLIESVPSTAQKQDLGDYELPAMVSGVVLLRNESGEVDDLIDDPVYGNELMLANLDEADITEPSEATRSDLDYLASLIVEDYAIGQRSVKLRVQDARAAQNISIPQATFSATDYPNIEDDYVGDVIPLAYGPIREMTAIPVTGGQASGAVTYRVAVTMTDLGDVYTLQDDVWTSVTPTASDAAAGEFTLAAGDARNASDGLFKCKVVDCEGIANTYASDVIVDLFERYLEIAYSSATYDTTEWEAEETALDEIGVVFDSPVKLFEAIHSVQTGANLGFRFEFLPGESLIRTIRVDDWTRDVRWHIPNTDIFNLSNLEVETDTALLAAEVQIEYAKSYDNGIHRRYLSTTEKQTVLEQFRQTPRLTLGTHLTNETDAIERAAFEEERHSSIHGLCNLLIAGNSEYLQARIYDIVTVEMAGGAFDLDAGIFGDGAGDRAFYGLQKCQIVAVDPDYRAGTNRITVLLIEQLHWSALIPEGGGLLITEDGKTLITEI